MRVLGLETSCDETAAAVVEDGARVLSSVVHSQIDLHQRFGGVVPEVASRDHLRRVVPVVEAALDKAGVTARDLDLVAVTHGPGLIGALLVGLQTAKSLAWAWGVPIAFVNHVEAHTDAVFLDNPAPPPFPHVALCVSGGHTSLFLVTGHTEHRLVGHTLDDAAGEAFDKAAKLMGLPYPGGVSIDRVARAGNRRAVRFPRPRLPGRPNLFSFSGLKTAVRAHVEGLGRAPTEAELADIAASFQEAVCDVLVERTLDVADRHGVGAVVVAGGVAANSRLRERFAERAAQVRMSLHLTDRRYCTDNAAMIAGFGHHLAVEGRLDPDWMRHDAFSTVDARRA
jgi:N6-L-threonylcarbamoyladenine synthase